MMATKTMRIPQYRHQNWRTHSLSKTSQGMFGISSIIPASKYRDTDRRKEPKQIIPKKNGCPTDTILFLRKAMTEGDVTKSATFGGTEDDVKCGLTVLALLGTDGKKYEGIVLDVNTNTNGRLKEEVNRCLREIGCEPIPDL